MIGGRAIGHWDWPVKRLRPTKRRKIGDFEPHGLWFEEPALREVLRVTRPTSPRGNCVAVGQFFVVFPIPTGTLLDEALQLLLTGVALDQATFLRETGSWRLSAVIHRLRVEKGWPVHSLRTMYSPVDGQAARSIVGYQLDEHFMAQLRSLVGVRIVNGYFLTLVEA